MEKKKSKGWMGILRVVLWIVILISWSVGAVLIGAGSSSEAMAEGTEMTLMGWGATLVMISLLLLVWNFVWGMKRWAEKWHERKWKVFGGVVRTIWGGAWRGVVFGAMIILAMLVIAPKVEEGIVVGVAKRKEKAWLVGQVGIEEDFRQGNISPDEYLRYTLAVAYGTEEVPEKYRTKEKAMAPDITGIIDEYGEQLSRETLELALDVVMQRNIEVGLDVSGNVAKSEDDLVGKMLDYILGTKEAQAYTKKATTLNKAVLSGEGNFVVYYTNTGDDAISDEQAEMLAEMMERIVTSYKEKLGLEYSFTFHEWNEKNVKSTEEVLVANGIDKEAYKTAMAVYVADPYKNGSNTLAFYSGEDLAEWGTKAMMSLGQLLGVDEARWTKTVVGVPNITILSSNLDDSSLELVTAHELGHHYQHLHCQAELGKKCPAGKFAVEGGANLLAINVVDEQPEDNLIRTSHHNHTYIGGGICYKISEVLPEPPKKDACHTAGSFEGYPSVAFWENYYEMVEGSFEKIMDALLQENALGYLREQATDEEFRKVITGLSQRNLTNEYNQVSLWAIDSPFGVKLNCGGKMMCEKEFPLRPTAMKYIYLMTEEYDRVKVTVTGTAEDAISVLGKKDGKWELIAEGMGEMEYTAEKMGDYETVVFAVANTSITNAGGFKVKAVAEDVVKIIDVEASTKGCTVLDFQKLMDSILTIGKSSVELMGMLGIETGDISDFEQGIAEAKQEMSGKKISVCELQVKKGVEIGEVEKMMRKTMWLSYNVFSAREAGVETRIVAGMDRTRKRGEIYLLGEEEGKIYILEIRAEEE